ncbi:MAG: hypothetical protein HND51_06755 [Chloroflexi bacterium]|nr:hypothetical protein [Chloroflexota bacterium]
MDKQRRKWLWPTTLGAIALLGFGLVWASTIWGAGLISDSFQYVSTARNLAGGLGFQFEVGKSLLPLVHYPPLFPSVLAGFEIAGIDALLGARLINALLFGANAVLVGVSIEKITASKVWGSIGALLTAIAAVLLGVHSWALSEPLYIFLGLVGWLILSQYLENNQLRLLVAASGLFGLAFLARYAGVAIVVAGALAVLLFSTQNWRKRGMDAALLGIISVSVSGLWAVRITLLAGSFGARELQYIPLTAGNIESLLNNILTWVVPFPLVNGREAWILFGLFIGLVVFGLYVRVSDLKVKEIVWSEKTLFRLHSLYFWVYPVSVVAAKMFLDRGIGLNDRMLSPMLVSLMIVGVSIVAQVWKMDQRRWVRVVLVSGAVLFTAFYGVETGLAMRSFRGEGLGLARADWHSAESIQAFADFEDEEFYSNSPSSLYLWSYKPANNLNSFARMAASADPDRAYIVVFAHVPTNKNIEEMAEGVELVVGDEVAEVYLFVPEGE